MANLKAPVGEMHAAAAQWVALTPQLAASAPTVSATTWPSAAATAEMHAATELGTGTLAAHLVSRAGDLTESAVTYTAEDLEDADPFKALEQSL